MKRFELDKNSDYAKRPRVLVVDDDRNTRRSMCFMLGAEFDVTPMESGDKAYEQIRQGVNFDVVSLDLDMPGMSGIETLKAIKAYSPDIEALIITGHSGMETAKEALKLGAYEYIDKPFEKDIFREVVRKGVERRRKTTTLEKAQKQLELVKAELIQSEKFAALGELIAGFVHEINNPLGAILGFSDLLLMEGCSPEETHNYLMKINDGVQLCRNISEKFLAFSRKQEKKRENVHIDRVIDSTLELKKHDFKVDSIQVVRNLAGNLPDTMADFHELQQVFLNVINNAHQAMKVNTRKKVLTVSSECEGKTIRVGFQDTGPGIPGENLQKIFEPLFTTKKTGEGTGLGLSLSCEIIKEHEGNIYVASEPGKGACFVIELPVVDRVL